jgi:hypothetical protein
MQELLDEIMDEAAKLLGKLSATRRQFRDGEKVTEAQVARLKRHAVRISNMLQAVEVEQ